MIVIAFLLLIAYTFLVGFVLKKSFVGEAFYFLCYLLYFLPFYTTFQLIVFQGTEQELLVHLLRYSKDLVILMAFLIFLFGSRTSLSQQTWQLRPLDKLMALFMGLVALYMLLPLGTASFFSKLVYARQTFLIGIVYFFGRNTLINPERWAWVRRTLSFLALLAFGLALAEYLGGVHLHQLLGYGQYNRVFNEVLPTGHYGLSWTFERSGGIPRYAAYFADPLEFSASLLLFISLALYRLYQPRAGGLSWADLTFFTLLIACFLMAGSRASTLAAFGIILFALFLHRSYQWLRWLFFSGLLLTAYLWWFASEDTLYFLWDSLLLADTSSLGHLIEWLAGIDSMLQDPLGIGLAMSGNAGAVDQRFSIGGENQFLIYGVQMGVAGLLVYVLLLFRSIRDSLTVFRRTTQEYIRSMAHMAALTKLALLIPLLTANAELYLFVSLFSWFMVGHVQQYLPKEIPPKD